ncbi:MAG: hypothetical protein Q9172_004686 [Xanthocarpia lactea]
MASSSPPPAGGGVPAWSLHCGRDSEHSGSFRTGTTYHTISAPSFLHSCPPLGYASLDDDWGFRKYRTIVLACFCLDLLKSLS